jgi:hypothetical protein
MPNEFESVLKLNFNDQTSKTLDYFWIGFTIYTASFALSTSTTVNYTFCQLIQLTGILLFLPSAIKLINWKFNNQYLKTLFIIYCFWQLFIISRGFSFDYANIKVMLFDAEAGLFRFFVPLILLFPKNLLYYKKIINVIIVLGVIFILYDIVFIHNLLNLDYENNDSKFTYEHFVKILSVSCGLILLTFPYQTKRNKYIAFTVIIVSILFSIIRARRALLIMTISPLVITYILLLYSQKKNFIVALLPFLIVMIILTFGGNGNAKSTPRIFRLLSDRATEDTRTGVEEAFYHDMTPQDWIIGKGINGKYYCPGIDIASLTDYRSMIETDYLNIILKGGLISLGLLLLIAIPSLIKGLFYSKNILSKAAAIWILLWIVELYPANVSNFSLHYLLFWMAIGICNSTVILEVPENEIAEIFSN